MPGSLPPADHSKYGDNGGHYLFSFTWLISHVENELSGFKVKLWGGGERKA